MKQSVLFLCVLFCGLCFSQNVNEKEVDSLYKEDHFYAGVTYNLLGNRPSDVKQSGFSLGFHLGFIKDIPINKRRNWALGIGLGVSTNSFNQNIFVNKANSGQFEYSVVEGSTFSKNRILSHLIELPLEIRWRTSTPTEYNFWRIYTGFKVGYAFVNTTRYTGDLGVLKQHDNSDFNNVQYGVTLSAGYNTWNLHLYYGLNSVFSNDAKLNDTNIDMNTIKIGLMFYIL